METTIHMHPGYWRCSCGDSVFPREGTLNFPHGIRKMKRKKERKKKKEKTPVFIYTIDPLNRHLSQRETKGMLSMTKYKIYVWGESLSVLCMYSNKTMHNSSWM